MLRVALIARGRNRYRRISSLVTPFSHISPRLREVHKFPVHAHPPPLSLSLSLFIRRQAFRRAARSAARTVRG